MAEKAFLIVLMVYSLLTLGLYIATGVLLIIFDKQSYSAQDAVSSEILNEVAKSWQTVPIVDAIVVSKVNITDFDPFMNKCPDDYPEYILERMFYGAGVACDCIGIWSSKIHGDNQMNVGEVCDRNQTRAGCRDALPMAPFAMHSFGNKMICGRRGGTPFINATRPDPVSKLCPIGTSPCSNFTSADNTICYS